MFIKSRNQPLKKTAIWKKQIKFNASLFIKHPSF